MRIVMANNRAGARAGEAEADLAVAVGMEDQKKIICARVYAIVSEATSFLLI